MGAVKSMGHILHVKGRDIRQKGAFKPFKDHFIRYRNDYKNRENKMTICIAAICDLKYDPKIIYCADRQVTAGVKYVGLPKIRKITNATYVMLSTNDADASDTILKNTITQFFNLKEQNTINFIQTLKDESFKFKRQKIEDNVLQNYQIVFDKFTEKPEGLLREAKEEVKYYQYPLSFDMIVFGLDVPNTPILATVNQDGEDEFHSSSGFVTIGIAQGLAFSEITKYSYNRYWDSEFAIPLIYRTKKICERYEGIDGNTDFGMMYFDLKNKDKPTVTNIDFHEFPELIEKLDACKEEIDNVEKEIMRSTSQEVKKILYPSSIKEDKSTTQQDDLK